MLLFVASELLINDDIINVCARGGAAALLLFVTSELLIKNDDMINVAFYF